MKNCFNRRRLILKKRRNANLVPWRPPPDDWLKTNVDATFKKESGNGIISAIVKDKEGEVLLGFTGKIQANLSIVAKAMAIRQALIISMGNNSRYPDTFRSLFEKDLTWTPRNGNLLAHAVAKAVEAELYPQIRAFNHLQKFII
ncbi:hypothetical protein Ahy_A05g025461 [Arachis hypogaea]|uniref:Uncharacterized protein n=1 Tax=Arachis hypogaea TaxID=3818 RepID=A0A445D8R3_ARAHY|nr:hypothetical protein Ahy_A05g025461 [Arachis hypogaea]